MDAGRKADTLQQIPQAWVPPYFTVDSNTLQKYGAKEIARIILEKSIERGFASVIIRSSAIDENLNQRGRFTSREFDAPTTDTIQEYIEEIRRQGVAAGSLMGLIVQRLLKVERKGHLSNERRVSATRNQWEVEVEFPRFSSFRVNSQRDRPPSTHHPLKVGEGRALQRLFGAIGSWANSQFESRVHFEWVSERDRLWVVQIDLEDDAPDEGLDPWAIGTFVPHLPASRSSAVPIVHWTAFLDDRFRKVKSIQDFARYTEGNYPDVYVLRAADAAQLLNAGKLEEKLRESVGERLVCRTDVSIAVRGKMQGLNLPRTDTKDPVGVVHFIERTAGEWLKSQIDLNDGIFIIHEYLPAVAGAWADADPDQRTVQVDALWGLPDGLQYLDHDSFEYDLKADQIVSEYIRHKAQFVSEERDGSWRRKAVKRDFSRHSSISREDVARIAQITHALAEQAGSRLRVMWFVDVRKGNTAKLFPWFAHKPEANQDQLLIQPPPDQSLLRTLPVFSVRSPHDLDALPSGRFRLRLDPDAEYMRNNQLIERIAELAAAAGHSVEIRGSGLCHAYYLLTSLGVAVVTPHTRRHVRVRGRQTFGKLVRDKIPEKIQRKGERVKYVTIGGKELQRALAAKLIEEAQEVANSTNVQDVVAELSDVLEIAQSIAKLRNVDWKEVEERAATKRAQVGSFNEAKYLIETDIPTQKSRGSTRKRPAYEAYQARRHEDGVIVPFLSLIEDATEFVLKRRAYSMRLRPEGVFLEELPEKEEPEQLDLPLNSEE